MGTTGQSAANALYRIFLEFVYLEKAQERQLLLSALLQGRMQIGLPAVDRVVLARVLLLAGMGTTNAASHDLGSPRNRGAMAWSGHNSLRNEGPFLGSLAWHVLLPN
jgi:hypothetical protein